MAGSSAGSRRTSRPLTAADAGLPDPLVQSPPAGLKHARTIFRSADSLRALLRSLPFGLLITTPARRIVLINQACAEMFGYRQEQLLGARLELLVPPRSRARHAAYCTRYQADAPPRAMGPSLERLGLRRDGTLFPVDVTLSPLWVDGRFFVIAVVRDATNEHSAARELRRLRQELDLRRASDGGNRGTNAA